MQAEVSETVDPSERVFNAFLYELHERGITEILDCEHDILFNRRLHHAFLHAKDTFPDLMSDYEFITLEKLGVEYGITIDLMIYTKIQEKAIRIEGNRRIIARPEALEEPDVTLREVAKYICDRLN